MNPLERLLRRAILAIWRDLDIGEIDIDKTVALAADVAELHAQKQQPRVTPKDDGLEIRWLIPWDRIPKDPRRA